jgi:hypothetical protein
VCMAQKNPIPQKPHHPHHRLLTAMPDDARGFCGGASGDV